MGKNKFKLSNMIPNVWFHKLKDTTKTKHHTDPSEQEQESKQPDHFNPRKSYYITRDLVPIDGSEDPPRKSSEKRRSPRKRILRSSPEVVSSSISAGCRCRSKPEYSASSSSFSFSDDDDSPQLTKPAKFNDMVNEIKNKKERTAPVRKFGANSPGVRLRVNSPKIRSKKLQGLARKSVSSSTSSSSSLPESFAVVKSSFDPERDFRESMVEMISENNIRTSKDLEDLLACYLSLNSDEYHELIIKVFKQIWFDLNDVQFKS